MTILDTPLPVLFGNAQAFLALHWLAVLVVLLLVIVIWRSRFTFNLQFDLNGERAPAMTTRAEEEAENAIIADCIVDGLEEAVHDGKLTRERVKFWYTRFGNILSIKDLLPRGELLLKERIRNTLPDLTAVEPRRKLSLKTR